MADYVFSLGLIPVQEWIAQARRSRDLRAGSVFLWHVMAKVLARLERESEVSGVEVWTPSLPEGGFKDLADRDFEEALEISYGLPNRASGICQAPDEDAVRRAFEPLQRNIVDAAWKGLRGLALERLNRDSSPAFWSDFEKHWQAYRERISGTGDCPLTLIWVAAPAPYPKEQRRENLRAVYAMFTDLKRSRPPRVWEHGKPVGKCTQCGQREAMGPADRFDEWQEWYARRAEDPWIEQGRRLDAVERLCYVCLVKRVAGYMSRKAFLSTGEVAAGPWLDRLKSVPALSGLVERLRRKTPGDLDLGRVLYGSIQGLLEPERTEVRTIREEIRKEILTENRKRSRQPAPEGEPSLALAPTGALALLAFDGDDMGRQVQEDPNRTPGALERFAKAAAGLLEKHQAVAFYLAGDEGLTMAPAETALDLALALREAFTAAFAALEAPPTLSLGLAFFEQGRPMRGAILAARGALEDAKRMEGKDAFGVAVETASGSRWGFTAHWGGPLGDDWRRIRNAAAWIRDGSLSAGWAYDAERFVETLPVGGVEWKPEIAKAARAELRRLFLRRFRAQGKTAEERRAARRQAWRDLPGDSWWEMDTEGNGPQPQQLHLIGFLARQGSTKEQE